MATYSTDRASNATTLAGATVADASIAKPKSSRLLSLDVFRGATILAMILVNNPGEWGEKHQYWPVDHAPWHGWTPTDLIFPFFLFIVGTSLSYSLRKFRNGTEVSPAVYWRIIRRTALLIFLGWMPSLLLKTIHGFEGIPFDVSELHALGALSWMPDRLLQIISAVEHILLNLNDLRLFGVLVRIAIVYFCASLIVLHVPLRAQVALAVVILLGYWATLAFLPDPHDYWKNLSNEHNVTVVVDRWLIGDKHMYHGDPPTEPEGFLSTFPAIVSALMGYWAGLFIQRRGVTLDTVVKLAIYGLLIAAIGQAWHFAFPINKKLWTSSFVLLTGGLGMTMLAACLWMFDIRGWRRLARPFEIVGVNAIFVFVCSGLLSIALGHNEVDPPKVDQSILQLLSNQPQGMTLEQINDGLASKGKFTPTDAGEAVERMSRRHWLVTHSQPEGDSYVAHAKPDVKVSLHGWLYDTICTSHIADPKFASLGMAILTVAFWWFMCWIMARLGWTIRV